MTLTEAKLIADHHDLSVFSRMELAQARLRLADSKRFCRNVGDGRARQRLLERIERLDFELETFANQDEARRID